jgi:FkbM family methyltransferase
MLSNEEKKAVIGLLPFLNDNPVVIDVGSNKGHWSDVILEEFGDKCQLYLFEPNEKLLSFTEIKYEYKTNVIYAPLAAHKENFTTQIYYFENYNNELSSLYKSEDWEKENLPMKTKSAEAIRIDTYCDLAKIDYIDFLKIDCEGADVDVLIGCEGLLKEDKIKIIQIEYSEHYKRANHTIDEVFDIAHKYGYKVYAFVDDNYWEIEKPELCSYDNYYITKEEIHNHSTGGWNNEFKKNTSQFLETKFDFVLEVGCFEGLTTKYICENLLSEGGRVIVVDPLLDYYYEEDNGVHPYFKQQYQRFLRNTKGLPVELKRGKSEDELPKMNAFRFSFVYIDGMHFHPFPYQDGCWAFAETKIGGVILFDDYLWNESSQMSIDKFLDEFAGAYEILEKGYQVMIKKTHNRYNQLTQEYYK